MNIAYIKNEVTRSSFLLKKAVRLAWDSAPYWTAASGFLILVLSALNLASLYLMKLIVDAVSGSRSATPIWVLILVCVAGFVALLIVAASSLDSISWANQSALVIDRIQESLHAKSVEVDLEYYENSKYYETLIFCPLFGTIRPSAALQGRARQVASILRTDYRDTILE